MNRLLQVSLFAAVLVPVNVSAAAEMSEIITTPPEGRAVSVYADFRSEENVFGFVWDYHSTQTIIYGNDGKVYIPNVLMRKMMPAYLVGELDEAANTVTVAPGQMVYSFPNMEVDARLYMLNAAGLAGNAETGVFNDEPIVFDIAGNGTLSLRTSSAFPMFGIAGNTSVDEVYALGADLQFVPVEPTLSKIKYYNLSYIYDNDEKRYDTTISGYDDGDALWFKGFDPRYPEAWMKASWAGEELRAPSFQLLNMSSMLVPTVMAASTREMNASGEYDYTHYNYFVIDADKDNDTYSAFTEKGWFLTNLTSYDEETADAYQAYRDMHVTPIEVNAAVPGNPVFVGYDAESLTSEDEFKFDLEALSVDGDALLKDALMLRYYINGEVYVFRNSVYTRQSEDMELIPYNYSDNGAFVLGGSGVRHYTYFQRADMPADLQTIGVEAVYVVNGVTSVSERLVYNVKTGKTSYESAGIENVSATAAAVTAITYFDLQGRPVAADAKGLLVKVTRYADGRTETAKVVR